MMGILRGLHIPPSLRHRRFFLLWAGLVVSVAGTQMQAWSLLWHVRELTGEPQPLALGAVGLTRVLPIVVFSLIGGALADLFNRRKLLLVTQSCMAGLALILGLLTLSGQTQLWHIYVLVALQATASAFDLPARQALVPNLVPKEDLPNAFSMTSIAYNTGSIAGPALSGLMIAVAGLEYIYLLNAFSYLAVILALLGMGNVEQQRAASAPGAQKFAPATMLADIRHGIRYIAEQPMILSTMIMDFFATFFSSADNLLPIITRDVLGLDEIAYGWLSAAQASGAVTVGVIMSQVRTIRRQGSVFLGSVMLFGAATIAFGLSTHFILAWIALAVVGASDAVSAIIRNTIRQLHTPDYIRGRMTSVNQIFFMGGPQLGEVETGIIGHFFGPVVAVVSGGVGCIVAALWVMQRWPMLRSYDGALPDPSAAKQPATAD